MREHALAWAARGFRVFPLREGSKLPLWDGWTDSATTDPAQIAAWWRDGLTGIDRDFNIGVLTDGLAVVDLDTKNGKPGIANFLALDGDFGTLTVRTATGGLHLYYRPPYELANSQGDAGGVAPGIDIRGFHGYVIAPGSRVAAGEYRVEIDAPLADVPGAILSRSKRPGEARERGTAHAETDTPAALATAADYLRLAPPAIEGLGGNNRTYMTALEVRDRGVSEAAALDLLLEHYNPRCEPPWSVEELQELLKHAYTYGQNAEGAKAPEAAFAGVQIDPAEYVPTQPAADARPVASFGNALALATLPPRPWIFHRFMLHGEVTALIAPGGVGKSQATLTVAVHLAMGLDFLGFRNAYRGQPRGSVIYNGEDSLEEMSMRLHATCIAYGFDPAEVVPKIALLSGRTHGRNRLVLREGGMLVPNRDGIAALHKLCAHPGVAMLGLDPLSKLHSGNPSDAGDMNVVMETLDGIARAADVGVLLSAHTAKQGGAGSASYVGSADAALGSVAIRDNVRAAFTLMPPTEEDCATYKWSTRQKRARYLRLDDAKMNRTLQSDNAVWVEKVTISLPNGEDVGAFLHANVREQGEQARRQMAEVLRAEATGRHTSTLSLTQAATALRQGDPVYGKLTPSVVKSRIAAFLEEPVRLDDGTEVRWLIEKRLVVIE